MDRAVSHTLVTGGVEDTTSRMAFLGSFMNKVLSKSSYNLEVKETEQESKEDEKVGLESGEDRIVDLEMREGKRVGLERRESCQSWTAEDSVVMMDLMEQVVQRRKVGNLGK